MSESNSLITPKSDTHQDRVNSYDARHGRVRGLGRALVPKLLERGERVRVYDLKPPPARLPGLEFWRGDVRDGQSLIEASRGCGFVFHLAAKMPRAGLSERGFHEVNVRGTLNVADACVKNRVRRLVFASTTEIYGPQPIRAPLAEEAPKLFTGHYSRNKFESEKRLMEYHREHGLEVTFLRMPMIFGPGFYHEKSVLGLFWLIRLGLPIPISSPGMPISFVSSDDCAAGLILAAEKRGVVGEAFNVAAPDHPKLKSFLEDFAMAVGSRTRVLVLPRGLFGSGIRIAVGLSKLTGGKFFYTPAELMKFALFGGAFSIEKAKKKLGYSPEKTCLQACVETYAWYFAQGLRDRMDIFFRQRV